MTRLVTRLVTETAAQDLAEYGIALAVIAAAVIIAAFVIGGDITAIWNARVGLFAAI